MKDIRQTVDGDVDISGGDFAYTESTKQHQRDILISGKGHFKEFPSVGVDIVDFINDSEHERLLRTVRREFARDGMTVIAVAMEGGSLNTEAYYETGNSK